MNLHRLVLTLLVLLLVAGCAQSPTAVEPPECPEPPPCPVCEVPECPVPEPRIVEKIVQVPAPAPPAATTAGEKNLPIVGGVEWVVLEAADMEMEARVDTGAETTAVHAENIQLLEKEGKRYVRFTLQDGSTESQVAMEEPLRRTVLVKQAAGEPDKRYVVRMWLKLGEMRSRVEVTLSDREDFEYPLLLGRNFLVDLAIVDVSRKHTQAH